MRAHSVNFDTHKHVKALIEKGATEGMAEAIVTIVTLVKNQDNDGLATKDQLITVEERLSNKITQTKSELKEEINEVRTEIAQVRTEIAQVRTELKEDIASVRTEIAQVRTELKEDIASVRTEIAQVRTELKEDIASVKSEITNIKYDMLKWIIPFFAATIVTILYAAK